LHPQFGGQLSSDKKYFPNCRRRGTGCKNQISFAPVSPTSWRDALFALRVPGIRKFAGICNVVSPAVMA
jgi:hypothetical protein